MTDQPLEPEAKPPVRDSGPGEGVRGNREVPPTGAADPDDDRLAQLTAERDEYLDLLQRKQAELENYRSARPASRSASSRTRTSGS